MKNIKITYTRTNHNECGTSFLDAGFTLVEIMAVIVIIAVLAAIAIPKLGTSSEVARQKADIATGHELKIALDRYQLENGIFPKSGEIEIKTGTAGTLSAPMLVPQYISKLDDSVTQQRAFNLKKGFGIADYSKIDEADSVTNLIMLYLTTDGSQAEVRTYDDNKNVLWTSAS